MEEEFIYSGHTVPPFHPKHLVCTEAPPVVYLSLFSWSLYYMQSETIFRQTVTHFQGFVGFTVNMKTITYKASVFQKDFISHPAVMDSFP